MLSESKWHVSYRALPATSCPFYIDRAEQWRKVNPAGMKKNGVGVWHSPDLSSTRWFPLRQMIIRSAPFDFRILRAWFNIFEIGDSYSEHTHEDPMADGAGVLYLTLGNTSFRFGDDDVRVVSQEPGECLLFHKTLPHFVEQTSHYRVTLAFNWKGIKENGS